MHALDNGGRILWIGGTSSLAITYLKRFGSSSKGWILTGHQEDPPDWLLSFSQCHYECLDLTTITPSKVQQIFDKYDNNISTIIIGVRPLLFASWIEAEYNEQMLQGLQVVLETALAMNDNHIDNHDNHHPVVRFILHLSSVAVVNHLQSQHFVSETDPIPPVSHLSAPYDIFKRHSEEFIDELVHHHNNNIADHNHQVFYTHLRLSAIFSDTPACIQCSALALQARIGCYLPLAIDCNSGVNIAHATHALLHRARILTTTTATDNNNSHKDGTESRLKLQSTYYYTRPLLLPKPMPYGYYLQCYRQAHGLDNATWYPRSVWIPVWVVTLVVTLVHGLAMVARRMTFVSVPYLEAADYLLQVSSREHSFDCSQFAQDFGNHLEEEEEESILECFVRRRQQLEVCTDKDARKQKKT